MIAATLDAVLSLGRSIELTMLIKATLMLALGLGAARVARRARASVRHLILAVTFATLVVLPLLVLAAPELAIAVPVPHAGTPLEPAIDPGAPAGTRATAPTQVEREAVAMHTAAWRPSWTSVARWVWLAGLGTLCAWLLIAVRRVVRIRRHGLPRPELSALARTLAGEAGIRRSVDVLEHEDLLAPLTCGFRRPAILLPFSAREWDDVDVRRALVHELEHVRRADWPVQLAARVVCACYWFHPLAWIAIRRMHLDAERACDDAVLGGSDRTDYADQLVTLARRLSASYAPAILGMANRSDLSVRVSALLDDRQLRGRASVAAVTSAIAAAAVLVIAIAPLRAVARVTPDTTTVSTDRSSDITVSTEEQSRRRDGGRVRALDSALYEAASDGDLAEVDQLLQAGANVNATISGDGSPLIGAARGGHLEVVRRLLDRGADVNLPVLGDGNPLIAAASEGATSVVELLLSRGASVNQIVPGDETALIQASGEGHLDVVRLLVARGADVNLGVWVDSRGLGAEREFRSPLSMARKGRHGSVVALLLSAGARE